MLWPPTRIARDIWVQALTHCFFLKMTEQKHLDDASPPWPRRARSRK